MGIFWFLSTEGRAQNKGILGYDEGNLRLCRKHYANKGLWHVCFVDFVSVSLELLQCNLELKNSLKTLSYHFDFYVGKKYMECLLVDFSDYNQ